jgi:hypothetical protein
MDNIQSTLILIVIGSILVVLVALAVVLIAAHFVARAARMKNRSYASFFWLSLLTSPIITGFVVAVLPFNVDDPRHPKNKAASTGFLAFTNK